MKRIILTILTTFIYLLNTNAQLCNVLTLPRQEQLSSERVLQVMQDTEGFLWYATEGGGLCRDDGRQMNVFRNDAERPDILGSNDIACMKQHGQFIIIGTFHGAYLLNKQDYGIRRLNEVDDYHVDDIIVTKDNHWWMTANKKVYEYSADGKLIKSYNTGDKYISHLHEDRNGHIWASQWEGGMLMLQDGAFVQKAWHISAAPSTIIDAPDGKGMWIGTIGKGVVRYVPDSAYMEVLEPTDNSTCIDILYHDYRLWVSTTEGLMVFNVNNGLEKVQTDMPPVLCTRMSIDLNGNLLVANTKGKSFAVCNEQQKPWFEGTIMTRDEANAIRSLYTLSTRPTAITTDGKGTLWFSTGKDIRHINNSKEETVLGDTHDVSAMTFSKDGTMWLATIYGTVMTYKDGTLTTDSYASNEHGDAIQAMSTDLGGNIVMVTDKYVRLYNPKYHTLRQQNIEADGVYRLELQETQPNQRWSQPPHEVTERMPQWIWWILGALILIVSALLCVILQLQRQRKRFLEAMKHETESKEDATEEEPILQDEWLQSAIGKMEEHLSDYGYSVEQLASDMCMSRMTLYRRLQAATGQNPTEFMRTIRLSRAADMLIKNQMNITEISQITGFTSVSYFCRSFRKMYGISPKQYQSQ